MNVKERVLSRLEENRKNYISGEGLSEELNVSRQAINKAVKSLRAEGHLIVSTHNGYRLASGSDVISAAYIRERTGVNTYVYDSVRSTNSVAASEYAKGGECIVIALAQTEGRKKDGGEFFSPQNKGIYLSIAMPLDIRLDGIKKIRATCGKVVSDVISRSCGKRAEPRGLDDVFIDGKKVCGILVECTLNAATERTESAVIGIGIYTSEECFDDTSLCSVFPDESRNNMIVEIYRLLKEKVK